MENNNLTMFKKIEQFFADNNRKPTLLLHTCCAVCCAAALERLYDKCDIICYFYNPNIFDGDEYEKRFDNLILLREKFTAEYGGKIDIIKGRYDIEKYLLAVKGKEHLLEGDIRCADCFTLRLENTAQKSAEIKADFFATTLTLSPHKNANLINIIGKNSGEKFNSLYLPTDFKKDGGVLVSANLCQKYYIYRQNYCGCGFPLEID